MTSEKPKILAAAAVIFDVDGTLVDSVDVHALAWQRTFEAFGITVGFDEVRSQIGKGGDQLMPVFVDRGLLERRGKEIEAYRQDLFRRDYLARVRGFPGVPELFATLERAGIALALGSSAKSGELQAYKEVAGIAAMTMVETTSEDAERSKPHPDIFEAALAQLKTEPARTMVVGDSPYDVTAARKAGMDTTALLCGGFPEASLRDAGAVEIYRDPEELLAAVRGGGG